MILLRAVALDGLLAVDFNVLCVAVIELGLPLAVTFFLEGEEEERGRETGESSIRLSSLVLVLTLTLEKERVEGRDEEELCVAL